MSPAYETEGRAGYMFRLDMYRTKPVVSVARCVRQKMTKKRKICPTKMTTKRKICPTELDMSDKNDNKTQDMSDRDIIMLDKIIMSDRDIIMLDKICPTKIVIQRKSPICSNLRHLRV